MEDDSMYVWMCRIQRDRFQRVRQCTNVQFTRQFVNGFVDVQRNVDHPFAKLSAQAKVSRRIIGTKNWSIAISILLFGTINILLRVRVKQHVLNVEQQEIRMQLDKMLLVE